MSFWSALARLFGGKPASTVQRWDLGITVEPHTATVTLNIDDGTVVKGERQGDGGQFLLHLVNPPDHPRDGGYLVIEAAGYVTQTIRQNIGPLKQPQLPDVTLRSAVVVPTIGQLTVKGSLFYMNGAPHRRKLAGIFALANLVDKGADVTPLFTWLRVNGFNGVRFLCQWHNPPNADDRFGPLPIDTIVATCGQLAQNGFTAKVCVLADGQDFGQDHAWQVDRVRSIRDALQGQPGVTLQVGNEPLDQDPDGYSPKNGFNPRKIADDLNLWDKANRPMPIDLGDYDIIHEGPKFKALDEIGDHGGRGAENVVDAPKSAHFMRDGWDQVQDPATQFPNPGFRGRNIAMTQDEPIAVGEVSENNRTDADPNNAADRAAGWSLGMAGWTIHERALLQGIIPGPNATECARRSTEASDFFPEDVPDGDYQHQELGGHPLETSKECSESVSYGDDHRKFVVSTEPTANYVAVPRNGWRIVRVGGWRGNYLELAR